MDSVKICVIGLGPWGLCVLERILSRARHQRPRPTKIVVHAVEPGDPGVGVHACDLPDYILANTPCSQVSMFVEDHFADISSPHTGPNLFEWARARDYRLQDDGYTVAPGQGHEISPESYLPRRLLGEYFNWFYERLLVSIPPGIHYRLHRNRAVNVERTPGGSELVVLENGERIEADYVFLTTGHTPNRPHDEQGGSGNQPVRYPVEPCLAPTRPGERVGVAGFGLVAMDVLAALTLGRGGRYQRDPDTGRYRYLPSGDEPRISMFSRSGLPYCPRPAISKPSSMRYTPAFFTRERIDQIRAARFGSGGDRRIDFMADVVPLLWDEMTLAYYVTSARLVRGEAAGDTVAAGLKAAWRLGVYSDQVHALAQEYGAFDPRTPVLMEWPDCLESSSDYQRRMCALIESEMADAAIGELRSPRKAAFELFRILRDTIRYAVDFGGLVPDSQAAFTNRFVTRINRVIVGPPKTRSEEMLALVEAGILSMPFGAAPRVSYDRATGKPVVSSTRLREPFSLTFDHVYHAYLDQPSVHRSASPLLTNLYRDGRIQNFRSGERVYSGALVDERLHPINQRGQPEARLWLLGPLTEGVKYFNFYLPSPSSRVRAFREADDCVQSIFAGSHAALADAELC